jgi:hypothetical protein
MLQWTLQLGQNVTVDVTSRQRNAGQSFQRLMNTVGAGLFFVFIYLDDILIASPDEDFHLRHMRTILQRLRQHGLLLNLSKCIFGQSAVDFLDPRVSKQGSEPLTKHLEAIQVFPQPRDTKDLQSFLGLVNFYRQFILAAARILHPLTSALHGGGKTKLE